MRSAGWGKYGHTSKFRQRHEGETRGQSRTRSKAQGRRLKVQENFTVKLLKKIIIFFHNQFRCTKATLINSLYVPIQLFSAFGVSGVLNYWITLFFFFLTCSMVISDIVADLSRYKVKVQQKGETATQKL